MIVQHVCSVIIFVVCFVGIFQERVSPVSVVGWGSFATFLGWLLWDWWVGQEPEDGAVDSLMRTRSLSISGGPAYREPRPPRRQDSSGLGGMPNTSTTSLLSTSNLHSNMPSAASSTTNLLQDPNYYPSQRSALACEYTNSDGTATQQAVLRKPAHSRSGSSEHLTTGLQVNGGISTPMNTTTRRGSAMTSDSNAGDGGSNRTAAASPSRSESRAALRVSAIKSAILIYSTLLGLSPILKSLTRSTSSDSIWAMSFWLLAINIFFFDYSSSWVGVHKFPVASLSTNAALMASTVLASRLPSTGQVFSLTLFSIEVFGLFPVFRRYARHRSWRTHVLLTALLVLGAGGGVGMILTPKSEASWPWKNGLLGMFVGCLISALAMGGCSWWLIGLQKYKNEIYGPWDPARPIIISRRHWDDDE